MYDRKIKMLLIDSGCESEENYLYFKKENIKKLHKTIEL